MTLDFKPFDKKPYKKSVLIGYHNGEAQMVKFTNLLSLTQGKIKPYSIEDKNYVKEKYNYLITPVHELFRHATKELGFKFDGAYLRLQRENYYIPGFTDLTSLKLVSSDGEKLSEGNNVIYTRKLSRGVLLLGDDLDNKNLPLEAIIGFAKYRQPVAEDIEITTNDLTIKLHQGYDEWKSFKLNLAYYERDRFRVNSVKLTIDSKLPVELKALKGFKQGENEIGKSDKTNLPQVVKKAITDYVVLKNIIEF